MHTVPVNLHPCTKGTILPLARVPLLPSGPAHWTGTILGANFHDWRAGTLLTATVADIRLRVAGRVWLPVPGELHMSSCPLLEALADIPSGQYRFRVERKGWALAWITLSDKGAAGERQDKSGPFMAEQVQKNMPIAFSRGFLLPDNPGALRSLIMELTLGQGYDLVLTSGGTGLSPRDTTPEALIPLLEKRLTGLEQLMMLKGLTHTPAAALSRGIAGTMGHSLVISLPGSLKAVTENIEAILPVLGHALDKLHGDTSDCGQ